MLFRLFRLAVALGIVLGVVVAGTGYWWAHRVLTLPATPFTFTVEKGASLKSLARALSDVGLLPEPNGFWMLGRMTQQATAIQAGTYRLDAPVSPLALLQKLKHGDVVRSSITFVEGVTFAEMRRQLESNPGIRATLKGLSATEVLTRVGAGESHPEGIFFPDTYQFSAGSSDLEILKASYLAMQGRLADAWAKRAPDLPYANPYQALIMASIIEKETGRADERPLIAGVFVNRLRIPMRLQTDPTVIYGMGERFDGNIRRRDLSADSAYNTYTRDGLPPTPIAMPGADSLLAAVQPALSSKLYFVATRKGDGSHYFSSTLAEHNRAVAKYQLGR